MRDGCYHWTLPQFRTRFGKWVKIFEFCVIVYFIWRIFLTYFGIFLEILVLSSVGKGVVRPSHR